MAAARDHLAAVGRLEADPGSPWVGLARSSGAFALAFGEADGRIRLVEPAPRRELLALAITYVDEALTDPPPDLEATHADLAALVGWLRDTAATDRARHVLGEALDAIDDGLAQDVVVRRLTLAADAEAAGTADEQADAWVGLHARRYRSVGGA